MRMGVPPSSVNCLVAAGFFTLAPGAEAMRVPKPAAGIITTTFIAGCKYTRVDAAVQIGASGLRFAFLGAPINQYDSSRDPRCKRNRDAAIPRCFRAMRELSGPSHLKKSPPVPIT